MTDAIFIPDGGRFVPTKKAGSPWGEAMVHGGPPAGLLARAIEHFAGTAEMQVSRLTVDLFRPVPMTPLEVQTRTVRAGGRIHVVEASLFADGTEVSRATGLLLRTSVLEIARNEGIALMPEGPDGIESSSVNGAPRSANTPEGFHTTIEVRWVSRAGEPGPNTAWIRIPVPLVAGETTTPIQRIAATADFGSAFSGMGRRDGMGFINADITLYLHRLPAGEWIGLQAERVAEPHGLGVATAVLHDTTGPVGRSVHALLANRRR